MSRYDERDSLIESLLAKPDCLDLFRGQKAGAIPGLHFTPDEVWAKSFGDNIIKLRLPEDARLKLLTGDSFEDAFQKGLYDEAALWQSFFDQGYDAIVGADSHDSTMIDVIVNPKHLERR